MEQVQSFFAEMKDLISDPNVKGPINLDIDFIFPEKLDGLSDDIKEAQQASQKQSDSDSEITWVDFAAEVIKRFV